MTWFSWMKTLSLVTLVGLGLTACQTIKPINAYESELVLSASTTEIRGGQSFTLSATLSYVDQDGVTQPLVGQPLSLEGEEFELSDTFTTDDQGTVTLTLTAPLLPEREPQRDGWIRTYYDGTVIEFRESIGRFSDASNAHFFSIKQSAPGRNNPGIPGAE